AGELANRICRERCGSYLTTSYSSNKFLGYNYNPVKITSYKLFGKGMSDFESFPGEKIVS
ncbi:MAG: hypothetical protein ABFS45_24925, partial [Pseudomonadota bacterium]